MKNITLYIIIIILFFFRKFFNLYRGIPVISVQGLFFGFCNGKIRQNGILLKGRIVFTESAMDPIKSLCKKSYYNSIIGLFISGRLGFIGWFLFILIGLILLYNTN